MRKEEIVYIKKINKEESLYFIVYNKERHEIRVINKTISKELHNEAVKSLQDKINVIKALGIECWEDGYNWTKEKEAKINWKITYPIEYV